MRRSRAAIAVVTWAVLGAVLVSCSGDDDGGGGGEVTSFDPADAAASLVELGAVEMSGTADAGGESGEVTGAADYGEGVMVLRYPFVVGESRADVEYRQIGDQAWVRRSPTTVSQPLGPALLVFSGPDEPRPWVEIGPDGPGERIVRSGFDPVALLEVAAEREIEFESIGTDEIDGEERSGFQATPEPEDARALGLTRLAVWVDGEGTPVRFEFAAVYSGEVVYDVAPGEAPTVEAPSADETYQPTPPPAADGPYEAVTSGTSEGVAWSVSRAPSTIGGTCWKVESDPAFRPLATPADDGGVCVAAIADSGDPYDQIAFSIDAVDPTPYDMFGMLAPAGSTATMLLADNTEVEVPVDPATGLVLYAGPLDPAAALLRLTLADTTELYCAPGSVLVPADVALLGPDEDPALRNAPWNCVIAADVEDDTGEAEG